MILMFINALMLIIFYVMSLRQSREVKMQKSSRWQPRKYLREVVIEKKTAIDLGLKTLVPGPKTYRVDEKGLDFQILNQLIPY